MAVDASHEGCFAHASRLYAVPSDSGHTVAETAASYVDASFVRSRVRSRLALHWSTLLGAVLGGLFLDASAWHSSGLTDPIDLLMLFGLGAIVGVSTAVGMRRALQSHPAEITVRLPAIEIPVDVARRSPGDATADELVLWSILTRRFRAARVALENLPFEQDATEAQARSGGSTITPAATSALAELAYVTARHDFEPVAELLGLPLPD
ncbi:hypothetical protein AX769_12860 [Frondihabitans sp. PAMC 28766]|uniref:hypothetical protein n=1 Tax=Frondihabitans sp. PAMC 28766 TaxID=1795630 RepID=UPI00078E4D8B|nr:hypothetical protein [Frondihabitans sp. PAMC 28766]AMM20870.1 hypothetical protein AX769_12860 [Frondihabitans sp. PAMC 28766]